MSEDKKFDQATGFGGWNPFCDRCGEIMTYDGTAITVNLIQIRGMQARICRGCCAKFLKEHFVPFMLKEDEQ